MIGRVFHRGKGSVDDVCWRGEIGFSGRKADDGPALRFQCFGFGIDFEGGGLGDRGDAFR